MASNARLKQLLYVMNPSKLRATEFLMRFHEARGLVQRDEVDLDVLPRGEVRHAAVIPLLLVVQLGEAPVATEIES